MNGTKQYRVGRLNYRVIFRDGVNDSSLIPSSRVFEREIDDSPLIFTLTVDDNLTPQPKGDEVGQFDCAGNNNGVYLKPDGGYQIVVSDYRGRACCLLETNADFSVGRVKLRGDSVMRAFGLNNSLMMMYAFSAADRATLLMHSSVVRKDDKGYLFLGVSGTGKSTHTTNWLRFIPGTDLLNDDNPVVRVIDDQVLVFGSPWSGKTPCYRDVEAPVGAFVQLKQAPFNRISRLDTIEAYSYLVPSCSVMKWDRRVYLSISETVGSVLEHTPVFFLENLPDEAAVQLSHSTLCS